MGLIRAGPGCSGGQGAGVDITNPGCLGESGRQSVYIPRTDNPSEQMCLVITDSDGDCSCQSEGYNFTPTGFCAELDDTAMASAQSFRFIGVSMSVDMSMRLLMMRSNLVEVTTVEVVAMIEVQDLQYVA